MKQIDRLPDVGVCMDSSFTIGQKKEFPWGCQRVRLECTTKEKLSFELQRDALLCLYATLLPVKQTIAF